jgi:hypothetical protein
MMSGTFCLSGWKETSSLCQKHSISFQNTVKLIAITCLEVPETSGILPVSITIVNFSKCVVFTECKFNSWMMLALNYLKVLYEVLVNMAWSQP